MTWTEMNCPRNTCRAEMDEGKVRIVDSDLAERTWTCPTCGATCVEDGEIDITWTGVSSRVDLRVRKTRSVAMTLTEGQMWILALMMDGYKQKEYPVDIQLLGSGREKDLKSLFAYGILDHHNNVCWITENYFEQVTKVVGETVSDD